MALLDDKVKIISKLRLDSHTGVETWETVPSQFWEFNVSKKSWALKDSYIKWKKKGRGTSRGKKLNTQSAHPKAILDEMPKKNTYQHSR